MSNQDTTNYDREREVLAQLYANDADVIKYLPFFFSNIRQLEAFFDVFGGKTLNLPKTYEEYVSNYLKPDPPVKGRKTRGVRGKERMKKKVLASYLNLFTSLEEVLKNECKRR